LDLSGYGDSEDEAHNSFQTVLTEYLRYTVNKKTLGIDLESHGWSIKKIYAKELYHLNGGLTVHQSRL